jgi:hypothetical protein
MDQSPITIRSLSMTANAPVEACLSRASNAFERRPSVEAAHSLAPLSGALRQLIDCAPDLRLAATAGD